MQSPQFILGLASELVVDLFAGGGGASTGIEKAIRRHVDVAVNHDREAVSLHQANHPQTKHYVSDVFEVDPLEVTEGRPVGLLWASPDCTFHSKARGGKPHRDRNQARRRRALAWVVVRWAQKVRPRVICLENVEEFQHWGPLLEDGMPCPERKGQSFQRWKKQLENLGYAVEWRELRGCDYGAPTIRKRLFLVARCDGQPIVWPKPTHSAPEQAKVLKLKPWRTAAECIDWSIPAPSIFERERPLAEATCRRIAKGVMRYVVNAAEPFIVPTGYGERAGQQPRTASIHQPLSTAVGANKHALVAPTLVAIDNQSSQSGSWRATEPLRTTTTENRHALVTAFLAKHYGGVVGIPVDQPAGTITTQDHHSLVAAHITKFRGESAGQAATDPMCTVTANSFQKRPGGAAPIGLVASSMVKLRGTSKDGQRTDTPLHTISAGGQHHAEVRAFMVKYYGTDQDPQLREPLHTVTTKDRFGIVMVHGEPYAIVDIGMRMLAPRELYRAQGFDDSYIIDHGVDPFTGVRVALTKTAQVRMCGNSVCPPMAQALVAANYREELVMQEAA